MTLADILAAVSLPLLNYKEAMTKATHPHLFALCDKLNATETFQAQKKRFAKE
jgi:glutathione S-transferase